MTGGGRVLLVVVSIVMFGAVFGGLYVLGTPAHQRKLRLDDNRIISLNLLSNGIHQYWIQHGSLPADISAIGRETDPITGAAYVYKRLDEESYSLCATFDAASEDGRSSSTMPHLYVPAGRTWKHPTGLHCFRFLAVSENGSGPTE